MREDEEFKAENKSGKQVRVMVADDSEIIRERTVALLIGEGAEIVAEAADGIEAIEHARSLSPDLVVLDIRMPRMSGLEVLAQIKSWDPAPVVVVITNYAFSAYRSRCAELGADHFLDKSTEFERLREIVADLVSTKATSGSVSTPATEEWSDE